MIIVDVFVDKKTNRWSNWICLDKISHPKNYRRNLGWDEISHYQAINIKLSPDGYPGDLVASPVFREMKRIHRVTGSHPVSDISCINNVFRNESQFWLKKLLLIVFGVAFIFLKVIFI